MKKLALLFLCASSIAQATTYVITTTTDDNTSNGNCTLREAIQASVTRLAVDTCPAGDGNDFIHLTAGTYPLNSELTIGDTNLTITGSGVDNTFIDGQFSDRIFHLERVSVPFTVNISNVTLENGNSGADAQDEGGCIYSNDASVNVTDAALVNCQGAVGGALSNEGGSTTVKRTKISGGSSALSGSAVNNADTTSLQDVTITGGIGGSIGGVFVNQSGGLTLDRVTVTGNYDGVGPTLASMNGGGVYITNSTFSQNLNQFGGGYLQVDGLSLLAVTQSTFESRTVSTDVAFDVGGGGTAIVRNSVVLGQISGNISSEGGNLFSDDPGSADPSDVIDANASLLPLQGGGAGAYVQARPLPTGSSGAYIADCNDINGDPVAVDAWGHTRVAPCNAGAVDYSCSNALVLQSTEDAGVNCSAGGVKLTVGTDLNCSGTLSGAEISGTQYICNGAAGDAGVDGQAGDAGMQGPPGSQGPQGPAGDAGDPGAAGANGPNGPTGPTGSNGPHGPVGAPGTNGADGVPGGNPLVSESTLIAGGVACPAGGVVVSVGFDNGGDGGLAGDGVLQAGEVQQSTVVCNGGVGPKGSGGCSIADPSMLGLLAAGAALMGLRKRRC